MASHTSLLDPMSGRLLDRRFLVLFLPYWPTDYLKRRDPALSAPLALYERIKGGLRISALDREAGAEGIKRGQNLADARALVPGLTVMEMTPGLLETGFAEFADWHSNASPLVAVMRDAAPFGDLVLDITGVDHLFGGEKAMLGRLLTRLRALGYSVSGAIAPTIGAAWGFAHFAPNQVVDGLALADRLDDLPVAALRLTEKQLATLDQMGLYRIGDVRGRPRKPLQARFGASLLNRIDQAYGHVSERMTPRLPPAEHYTERRFADPISRMEDVLATAAELAVVLCQRLDAAGLGAQSFHLFLYRVDHRVMTFSVNSGRVTRDPGHIAALFSHRAERLAGDYDAGFGIDMIRLAASSLDALLAVQAGAFTEENGTADIDQLNDRMSSRLGTMAVLRVQLLESHLPERAARLVPVQAAGETDGPELPQLTRPLRLLPEPERVLISAEVPDGLPAAMIWRGQRYRLVRAAGPERLGAGWWRRGERLQLVPPPVPRPPAPGEKPAPPPHVPALPLHDADGQTRDYYRVEDETGRRFWLFRLGLYGGPELPVWYLHGLFQ